MFFSFFPLTLHTFIVALARPSAHNRPPIAVRGPAHREWMAWFQCAHLYLSSAKKYACGGRVYGRKWHFFMCHWIEKLRCKLGKMQRKINTWIKFNARRMNGIDVTSLWRGEHSPVHVECRRDSYLLILSAQLAGWKIPISCWPLGRLAHCKCQQRATCTHTALSKKSAIISGIRWRNSRLRPKNQI